MDTIPTKKKLIYNVTECHGINFFQTFAYFEQIIEYKKKIILLNTNH